MGWDNDKINADLLTIAVEAKLIYRHRGTHHHRTTAPAQQQ